MPVGSSKSTESLTSASSADSPSAVRRALEAGVNTSSASSGYGSASSSDDETPPSVIAQNIAAIVAATGSDPNVAFCLPSTSAAAPADAAVNTSTSSDTSVDSLEGVSAKKVRFSSFNAEYMNPDFGFSRRRKRQRKQLFKDFGAALEVLKNIPYPAADEVDEKLRQFIVTTLRACLDEEQHQDVIGFNITVMRFAVLYPGFRAACRAPELVGMWQNCITHCIARVRIQACPADLHPFDHLLAAHIYDRGFRLENAARVLRDSQAQDAGIQEAAKFYELAARYGSVSAIFNTARIYSTLLSEGNIKGDGPTVKESRMLVILRTLADNLPAALGSLGFYMRAIILRSIDQRFNAQCLGILTEDGKEAFKAVVMAGILRDHPISTDAFQRFDSVIRGAFSNDQRQLEGPIADNGWVWAWLQLKFLPRGCFRTDLIYRARVTIQKPLLSLRTAAPECVSTYEVSQSFARNVFGEYVTAKLNDVLGTIPASLAAFVESAGSTSGVAVESLAAALQPHVDAESTHGAMQQRLVGTMASAGFAGQRVAAPQTQIAPAQSNEKTVSSANKHQCTSFA